MTKPTIAQLSAALDAQIAENALLRTDIDALNTKLAGARVAYADLRNRARAAYVVLRTKARAYALVHP